jgi:hypothetical protein
LSAGVVVGADVLEEVVVEDVVAVAPAEVVLSIIGVGVVVD